MKTALICPTVGQTRRGYERFFSELFEGLGPHIDVTLFKGGGSTTERERVVRHIRRTGALSKICRGRLQYPRYLVEFASFGWAITPHLLRGSFDLVHFIDPPLARPLQRCQQKAKRPFALLFSNAGPVSYDASQWVDHLHYLSPGAVAEAQSLGVPPDRITMLPIGMDPERVRSSADRATLRRQYGIGDETIVLLSVTTLNRGHKRIDYLIDEVSRLQGDVLLWIDAGLHPDGDESLLRLAESKLGNRFRHTHVPSERVGELLRIADLMVSSAIQESFGMAVVEAMSCDLPVVIHDSEHFRWLAGNSGNFVDMSNPGALADRLKILLADSGQIRPSDATEALKRFAWPNLVPQYLELYQRALRSAERKTSAGAVV